jgi:DNA (cytosine-5)-methyltransferase 1
MKKDRILGKNTIHFLDLFAGAGGLSEGFIRAGFKPITHVEMNTAACYTLKTRMARHWLFGNAREETYFNYLRGNITRRELYDIVPEGILSSVINEEICEESMYKIFEMINKTVGDKSVDLIIGGPPCQAYSLVGRARDSKRMAGDKRNYLYKYYAKFLEKYKPAYFLFENVRGLLSARDESEKLYFDDMKELFDKAGYEIQDALLSASDYGVLQNRKRIILVGTLKGNKLVYPKPEHWKPDVKVDELFSDLPCLFAGKGNVGSCKTRKYKETYLYDAKIKDDRFPVTWHQARANNDQDLEIYRYVVETWNKEKRRIEYNDLPDRLKTHRNREAFTDRFKVVAGNLSYSQTIVAHIAKDGHYYIHPDISQNRSLTPREAARLQTFPDDYYFESESGKPSRTAAFHQIGNAVPVLMAEKIAEKLMEVWK